MANALGTLNGALILQEALRLTFVKFPPLKTIALGFRELNGKVDDALLNQTVYTRTRVVPTPQPWGSAANNADTTDVPCTLTAQTQLMFTFTTTDYNSTNRNLIAEQAEPIAIGLAKYIISKAGSLWTIGNYNTIAKLVLASGWDYDNTDLVLKGKLDTAGVPDMDRFFAYNSPIEIARLQDQFIVANLYNTANALAIRDGKLPTVAGLAQAPYYNINADSGGLTVIGAAGTPDATVYAARAPKDPESIMPGVRFPGVTSFIEDPLTGFRCMAQQWIGTDNSCNTRLAWLEGYAVGNTNNLVLLTNA
jgi:hypothetical protein